MSLFDTGIRPAVDLWLLKKSQEKRDYGLYWSASSAGYCMRKVIFERLGVPPVTEDARKQRVFTSGDIFHKWMQEITKEAGLSIAQELELQDESLMIRGHIDDLVLVADGTYNVYEHAKEQMSAPYSGRKPDPEAGTNKHLILYDYKTQNSRAFSYKRPNMSHYHRLQLATYMYMLRGEARFTSPALIKQLAGKDVILSQIKTLSEARILSISKDDLRMDEKQLLWSPALEKEVVGYWTTLNGYWESRKLPKCTCADFEKNEKTGIGFMADARYNPYFYQGEPCSLLWLQEWKRNNKEKSNE